MTTADPSPAFYLNLDPYLDPGQTLKSQKLEFDMKNIPEVGDRSKTYLQKSFRKAGNQVYLLILINFHAPGSGSAFLICIQIQDSQTNADPPRIHNTAK